MSSLQPEPMKTIARHAKRQALVGDQSCLLCGAAGFEVVILTPAAELVAIAAPQAAAQDEVGALRDQIRIALELHHLFGRDLDPNTMVPLCRTCHFAVHALLRDAGIDFRRVELPTILHRILAMLRILASFFEQLADSLWREADRLSSLIVALDVSWPDWRRLALNIA